MMRLDGVCEFGPSLSPPRRSLILSACTLVGIVVSPLVQPSLAQEAAPTTATAPAEPTPAERIFALLGDLNGETDPETRRKAALSILEVDLEQGVTALLTTLNRNNGEKAKIAVCEAVASSPHQPDAFKQPLLALLEGEDTPLKRAAAAALAAYQDPELDAQIRPIQDRWEREQLVAAIRNDMKRLHELTPEADRPVLLETWLKSPLAVRRLTALTLIHEGVRKNDVPPNGVLAEVRRLIDDPNEAIRQQVVGLLRDTRYVEHARVLEAQLGREESPRVRERIHHALGLLRDPVSIPVCIGGLGDPSPEVAAAAAAALGELAGAVNPDHADEQLEPVIEALLARREAGLDNVGLRKNVLDAMATIADPSFLDTFIQHVGADEPEPAIRQAAVRGIGRVGTPDLIALIAQRLDAEEQPGIRESAVEAIGKLGTTLAHTQPVLARLDPKLESSAAVRQKAWQACEILFVKLPPADQVRFIASRPNETVRLASEGQLSPDHRQILGERLIEYASNHGTENPQAVLSFLESLTQAVTDSRFGPEWQSRVDDLLQKLRTATRPASVPSE